MSLADELKSLPRKPSTFDQWLETATDNDRALVLEYLRNPNIQIQGLVDTLRSNGVPISKETVSRIRRGQL